MGTINLVSIIDAYNNIDKDIFKKYLNFFGLKLSTEDSLEGIKDAELKDLENLILEIKECSKFNNMSVFDNYYLSYKIPQISKEFDLLRFGKDHIINIELKRSSTEEKIKKQLIQNKYYLEFLGRKISLFTYIVDENKLYTLEDKTNKLSEIDFSILYYILLGQDIDHILNIDNLFDPTNYLVSPFNSTEKFMKESYFLTNQQEEIKKEIIKLINKDRTSFISITGSAGTGKTLLTYDIAKEFQQMGSQVLILHCAQLNRGQSILNETWEWDINMARKGISLQFSNYDLVIVDEAQRADSEQVNSIVQKVKDAKIKCIFSYDGQQCLSRIEIKRKIVKEIESHISVPPYKLTDKIRTNKEIASFIKQLLDNKKNIKEQKYSNIELCYCKNRDEAKKTLQHLHDNNWKVPQYTPSMNYRTFHYEEYQIIEEDSAHSVIGQEYDNIVAVIDDHFHYNPEGKLSIKSIYTEYYSQRQMLFQILSRTRKKLYIVIINNEEVLSRCLHILS